MEKGRQRQCPILLTTLYGVPVYKSLSKDSTKDIEEQGSKGSEASKIKKAKADPKPRTPKYDSGIPAGPKKKVDAVKQKLHDLTTALDLLSKSATSIQIAPLLSPATMAQIDGASAATAQALAALDLLLGAPNAAELVEQGIKEAEEVVAEVNRKKKIITQLVDNAKTLAGVDTPSEPPEKKPKREPSREPRQIRKGQHSETVFVSQGCRPCPFARLPAKGPFACENRGIGSKHFVSRDISQKKSNDNAASLFGECAVACGVCGRLWSVR